MPPTPTYPQNFWRARGFIRRAPGGQANLKLGDLVDRALAVLDTMSSTQAM